MKFKCIKTPAKRRFKHLPTTDSQLLEGVIKNSMLKGKKKCKLSVLLHKSSIPAEMPNDFHM